MSELGLRLRKFVRENSRLVKQSSLIPEEGFRFEDDTLSEIRAKIFNSNAINLGDIAGVSLQIGLVTGSDKPFVISKEHAQKLISDYEEYNKILKPVIKGDMLRRDICMEDITEYIIFIPEGFTLNRYANTTPTEAERLFNLEFEYISRHLSSFKESLMYRTPTTIGDFWFETKDGIRRCVNNTYAFSKMIKHIKVCKINIPDAVLLVTCVGVNAPKNIRDFLDTPLVSEIFNRLLMVDGAVSTKLPNALRNLPFPKSLLNKDSITHEDLVSEYNLTQMEVSYLMEEGEK